MDFMALNCALENGHGGKCHVLYILPEKKQLKEGDFQKGSCELGTVGLPDVMLGVWGWGWGWGLPEQAGDFQEDNSLFLQQRARTVF